MRFGLGWKWAGRIFLGNVNVTCLLWGIGSMDIHTYVKGENLSNSLYRHFTQIITKEEKVNVLIPFSNVQLNDSTNQTIDGSSL